MQKGSRAPRRNNKTEKQRPRPSSKDRQVHTTQVGNISGGKGFAIGANARSVFVEIRSLLDLGILLELFKHHWLFLTADMAVLGIAILLWQRYADRFLISSWVLFGGIALLEIGFIAGYSLVKRPQRRSILLLAASLLALSGLTYNQYQRAVHPPAFTGDTFGVAVARFGEGPEFHNTPQAREISRLVFERLAQQAQENPDLHYVQFRPVGIVRTQSEAVEEGRRIRADLVIWGQLEVSDRATTLNFAVLETPDKVSNPAFPRVTPLLETSANGILELPTRKSEEIAANATTIAAFTFGLAQFFRWDFDSSARAFQEALSTSPAESKNYLYLLHLYYGLSLQWPGQLQDANRQFKLAAALLPEDPAAPLAQAFGDSSLGNLQETETEAQHVFDICTEYIKLHPSDPMAFYDRALADELLKHWDIALSDYEAAVQNAPDLFVARIGVIRMQLILNHKQEAIQAAQQAIDLTENSGANPAWAYLYLAGSYDSNNDPIQARRAYEKATSLAPQIDWFHFAAGEFYARTNDPAAAEAEFKSMIGVSSNQGWAYSKLGDFYANQNRLPEAVSSYRAALRVDPGVGGVWVALADVYDQLGQTEEERDAYAHAVDQEPSNFYARTKYGNFLYGQGDPTGALQQWEAARTIHPEDCDVLFNLGLASETLGNNQQARDFYTQALSLGAKADPGCLADARRRLDGLGP